MNTNFTFWEIFGWLGLSVAFAAVLFEAIWLLIKSYRKSKK